jgi:Spy/CpxP family protein refolding chaperone
MIAKTICLVVGALMLFGGAAMADAPLKSSLGLSMDQAKQVTDIEAKYRKPFSAKRTVLNTEMRAMRRAKIANDSALLAQQEAISEKMADELYEIRRARNAEISAVLNPQQLAVFEQLLQERLESGSTRDAGWLKLVD